MNSFARCASMVLLSLLVACGDDTGGAPDAEPDASEELAAVGAPCVADADCPEAGMRCLQGFETYAEPGVGMIIPRSYCTYAESCTSDEACGEGAGCWRPLDGVDAEELASLDFDPTPLVDFGQCLMTCEEDSDCGEGFVCQQPLLRALGGLASAPDRRFCVFDDAPPCGEAMRTPGAGKCTLTYALTGRFQITDLPLSNIDGIDVSIGPGTLVIEAEAADGAPIEGPARVKCFEMDQRFEGPMDGIRTAVRASFTTPNSATGTLTTHSLEFDICDYDESYGKSSTSWTLDATAEGPGCLEGYVSRGVVVCGGLPALCTLGLLARGSNYQDDTWTQPFNDFVFKPGWTEVAMGGADRLVVGGEEVDACPNGPCPAEGAVELPNGNPSRTWLSFSGELVETRCD